MLPIINEELSVQASTNLDHIERIEQAQHKRILLFALPQLTHICLAHSRLQQLFAFSQLFPEGAHVCACLVVVSGHAAHGLNGTIQAAMVFHSNALNHIVADRKLPLDVFVERVTSQMLELWAAAVVFILIKANAQNLDNLVERSERNGKYGNTWTRGKVDDD